MILLEHEYQKITGAVINTQLIDLIPDISRAVLNPVLTLSKVPLVKTTQWNTVSGVDKVEVTSGSITMGVSNDEKTLSDVSFSKDGNHYVFNFSQKVQLKSLTLHDFTYIASGTNQATTFSTSSNSRLVVSIPNEQTTWLPVYCVPYLSTDSTPKQYAGASYSGNTVSFPDDLQPVKKIRISVIKNFSKDNEEVLVSTISRASSRIKNLPIDLTLKNDTDNAVLFEHKGLFLNNMPNVVFDLINPAQAALDKQLAEQKPFTIQYTLQAKTATAFGYSTSAIKGALIRTFKGVSSAQLQGEVQTLSLDLSEAILDPQAPNLATTALSLSYDKLRLLEHLNDDVPLATGNVSGLVVSEQGVSRVLQDAEIANYPIDRIGIIGRAPESCELSLSLRPQLDLSLGEPLTDPGVVQLEASTNIQVIWVSLPQPITHQGALVLSLRANSGRFLWFTNPEPAIKVVVQDPDPGGREILINNRLLTKLDTEQIYLPNISIDAALFTDTAPVLSSNLFVNIELSDLTLRYLR